MVRSLHVVVSHLYIFEEMSILILYPLLVGLFVFYY